jgi:hypothetical protein
MIHRITLHYQVQYLKLSFIFLRSNVLASIYDNRLIRVWNVSVPNRTAVEFDGILMYFVGTYSETAISILTQYLNVTEGYLSLFTS